MESDSQTAVSSERLQSNGRIREEVGRSRTVHPWPSGWNCIKALATAASLQSRLDATRVHSYFFIIRISIQGQTPREADMIFPGVSRVTLYHFFPPACSLPDLHLPSLVQNSSTSVFLGTRPYIVFPRNLAREHKGIYR